MRLVTQAWALVERTRRDKEEWTASMDRDCAMLRAAGGYATSRMQGGTACDYRLLPGRRKDGGDTYGMGVATATEGEVRPDVGDLLLASERHLQRRYFARVKAVRRFAERVGFGSDLTPDEVENLARLAIRLAVEVWPA